MLRKPSGASGQPAEAPAEAPAAPAPKVAAGRRPRAVAAGFAWMFSGAPLPAPALVDAALTVTERWLGNRRSNRSPA
jgi:hypothetical protein